MRPIAAETAAVRAGTGIVDANDTGAYHSRFGDGTGQDDRRNRPAARTRDAQTVLDKDLLDILACPSCKKPVELVGPDPGDDAEARLVCTACGLRYPVRNDIPIMLIDEAAPPINGPDKQ